MTFNFNFRLQFILLIIALFSLQAFAQEQARVAPDKRQELYKLAALWEDEFLIKKQEAEDEALKRGWPIRTELEDGTIYELIGIENGLPEYRITNNAGAAQSTSADQLHPGANSIYALSGKGMIIGEWDGGATLLSHQEFGGRAIQRDGATSISNHATHVAGTLIGGGARPDAKGMAPDAILWTHDWNNDNAQMAAAAAEGLLISNHSYGSITGWARGDWAEGSSNSWHWWGDVNVSTEEDFRFGFYNNKARQWDQIAYNAPYYLIVKSAGNDRNDVGATNHFVSINNSWEASTDFRQRDGGQDGYDCIPTYGNSKNILTVGAVTKIPGGWNSPSDVNMSSFSGWGPTDDGRIKPDIVGAGVGLLSASSGGDDQYASLSGTSMSGPNVAGSLLLLQELHRDLFGEFMLSSTLKGLAIHTADQAGPDEGPDYRHGWGMLNVKTAADVLSDPLAHQIRELTLADGATYETTLSIVEDMPVKITLCWTDPEGQVGPAALNDRTPKLVNDLDVRLISVDDSSRVFFPYLLNPDEPAAPATKGDNIVDNVEVINVGELPAGEYMVVVSHKGSLRDGTQDFSLIISSSAPDCGLELNDLVVDQIPCANTILDSLILMAGVGSEGLMFSEDGMDFQESEVFYDVETGFRIFYIQNEDGCVTTQRVNIIPPQPLEIEVNESFVFSTYTGDGFDDNLQFSASTGSSWGGALPEDLVIARLVGVDDGSGGLLGCSEAINTDELEGNIAVVRRGSCEFGTKALLAEQAGAIAVLIVNNTGGLINMGGGASGGSVTIPAIMINQDAGEALINRMDSETVLFGMGNVSPIRQESCPGSDDGSIFISIKGGVGPYNIEWEDGSSSLLLDSLAAGVYNLTITDANNCKATESIELEPREEPNIVLSVRDESCAESSDGRVRIVNAFQLNGYEFIYSDGSTGSRLEDLTPGDYSLTAISPEGCEFVRDFTIEAGVELAAPEIIGSNEYIPLVPTTFRAETVQDVEFSWGVVGGEIIEGQNEDEVIIIFDEIETEAIVSLTINKEDCNKRVEKEVFATTSSTQDIDRERGWDIFPNPAKHILYIKSKSIQQIDHMNGVWELRDVLGRPVAVNEVNLPESTIQMEIRHLTPGIYMLSQRGSELPPAKVIIE